MTDAQKSSVNFTPTPAARNTNGVFDYFFAFVAVLWFSDAWIYRFDSQVVSVVIKEYSFVVRFAVYFLTFISFIRYFGSKSLSFIQGNSIYLLLCLYCILSALSFGVQNSWIHLSNLFLVVLVSAIFVGRFGLDYSANLIWRSMTVIILISLLLVHLTDFGLMGGIHAGSFRGAFAHKNNFGIFVACYVILTIGLFSLLRTGWKAKCLLLVLGFYLLLGTRSASALVLVFTFLALLVLVVFARHVARSSAVRTIVLGLGVLAVGIVLNFVFPLLLDALGRDAGLSGRSNIWAFFLERAWRNPWFGHGAFSMTNDSDLLYVAGRVLFFGARSSHNAYIEIFYNIGSVGLILYILLLAQFISSRYSMAVSSFSIVDDFPFVFAIIFVVYGFVESYQSGLNAGLPLLIVLSLFSPRRRDPQK